MYVVHTSKISEEAAASIYREEFLDLRLRWEPDMDTKTNT
jgi:hypothetical protein